MVAGVLGRQGGERAGGLQGRVHLVLDFDRGKERGWSRRNGGALTGKSLY